eukprot:Skav221383  [mRNA]  locus=scaffold7016:31023:31566:+ [translate_table: standard]
MGMSPAKCATHRRSAVVPVKDFHCVSPVMKMIHGDEAAPVEDGRNKVDSKRRLYLAMLDEVKLESFLRSHGFGPDPHEGKVTGPLVTDATGGEPLSAGVAS